MSLGEIEKLIMYLPQMWEDRTGEFANWENGWHISPVIQYEGHLDNPDELYFVSKRECPVHGKDEGYKKFY